MPVVDVRLIKYLFDDEQKAQMIRSADGLPLGMAMQ